MNTWMTEAARLMRQRAPELSDAHAGDIAQDLQRAWPDNAPALAVAKFLREVPANWKGKRQLPEVAAAHYRARSRRSAIRRRRARLK